MKMICDVPDEVIKCIKDGTWCGSSVAEKMIANGIPLSSSENPNKWVGANVLNHWIGAEVLNKIRAEIDEQYDRVHPYDISCAEGLEMALGIIDKYIAEGSDNE